MSIPRHLLGSAPPLRRSAAPLASDAPLASITLLISALLVSACADLEPRVLPPALPPVDGEEVPSGWTSPLGPCQLDVDDPSALVLTTTDFATGALAVVDLESGTVRPDVAEGSFDAVPFSHDDRLVVVHRHQLDRIDVLSTDDWSLVAQHGLPPVSATSSNPHAVAIGPDQLAYVTLFAEPALRVLDLAAPPDDAERGRIDLSPFDDDGIPEASLIVSCGDRLLVTAQRLGPGFEPRATDLLVAVDPKLGRAVDLAPETAPLDGLPLLGEWVRQLRRDPADPDGLTLLALSRGIERIDLHTGVRRWAVAPEVFAEVGIDERLLPQAFDVDERGELAFLAAYDPDFSQVRLYRVGLDQRPPFVPEPFADGFDSVERTLELVGDRLWYGSTRAGAPGLWQFDVSVTPPVVIAGPLPTGLPPYSMVAIP